MPVPLRSASVTRTVLYVVGATFVVTELIAIGYRGASEWREYQLHAEQDAIAALDMLVILHEQAMLNSSSGGKTDPAVSVLDGAMQQFSRTKQDVRLWTTMSPKVVAQQTATAAQQSVNPDIELPRDRIDREAISTRKTVQGTLDGWLRIARPSIMGQGEASHPLCASCHHGLANGDVIGTYSVGIDLAKAKARWRSWLIFEAASALGIVAICLGVIAGLLNFTTLAPLRRLTAATRRLATGNLSGTIDDANRRDEFGVLARSLEIFRSNLLEKHEAEEKIVHMAGHDALTGLPNRASLHRFLEKAESESSDSTKIAVASIDLDGLKEINDQHGQAAGDAAVKSVAENLAMANGEFVARVGGDEFIVVKHFKNPSDLFNFVARLKTALHLDVGVLRKPNLGAHIGVAVWPDDAATTDALLAKADTALQRAKSENLRGACYYEAQLDEAARRRRYLINELTNAIDRGELSLVYQVQKSLKNLQITGYEALLRWQHPELGQISPAEFISLAEQSGTIVAIGEWVLRTSCSEAASWPTPYKIAVNLSPLQIASGELPEIVHDILVETGLSPQRLELEITETAIITDKAQALETLRQIKALGVSIALDDFGTGYSSLETLRSFPFDKIKLDRFFIDELVSSAEAKAIVRAVVTLGRSLSIPVLAEGIETEDELSILRREQCSEGQGYLFGRPQPFVTFPEDTRHAS